MHLLAWQEGLTPYGLANARETPSWPQRT